MASEPPQPRRPVRIAYRRYVRAVDLFNTHIFIPVWCIAIAMGLATVVVKDPDWHAELWGAAGKLCVTAIALWAALTGFGAVWTILEALARRGRRSVMWFVFAALVLGIGVEFAYFGVRLLARLLSFH